MPLITISENLGSGGMSIARRVAQKLDINLYDDQRLQKEAVDLGIRTEDLKKNMDEKAPGFFDQILGKRPDVYMDFMEALVYEVSRRGDGIVIGHCSQMLLRDFGCALHVRIHSPLATRIRNLTNRQGISSETAEKLIRKSDHERSGFFKFNFHMDLNDSSLYDLIINTEKIGENTAVQFIVDLAASDEIKACSLTALETMERLALEKKIHAELMKTNVDLKFIHIDVIEPGVARISGMVLSPDDQTKITETVESLAGISSIQSQIVPIPQGYA
jgi:cytidylate kinase